MAHAVPLGDALLRRPFPLRPELTEELEGAGILGLDDRRAGRVPLGRFLDPDEEVADRLEARSILVLVAHPSIGRAARVAREARGASRPGLEHLRDARGTEQQPQPAE